MTLTQSLDAKAAATGDPDLLRFVAEARDRLERFDEVTQVLGDLVRASCSTVAFQVRPAPLSEALERADRTLEAISAS